MVGRAKTGSGKTLVCVAPLLQQVFADSAFELAPRAFALVPTQLEVWVLKGLEEARVRGWLGLGVYRGSRGGGGLNGVHGDRKREDRVCKPDR